MRHVILFLMLTGISMHIRAQDVAGIKPQNMAQIAGQYGGSDGILMFEDGRFALYGYATFVMGSYYLKEDVIEFQPDIPDLFSVYGFYNPALKDKTQIMYEGFQEGETYVTLDDQKPQLVFNQDANCFDWPYVHYVEKTPHVLTFDLNKGEHDEWELGELLNENQWQFLNSGYNDFIFVFNKPARYYMPFSGVLVELAEDGKALQLSENFGDRILPFTPQEKVNEWEDILQMKSMSDVSLSQDAIYANERYNMISFNPETYVLDQKTNLLVDTLNVEEGSDFRTENFHDIRILKKFVKISPTGKTRSEIAPLKGDVNSIFYTTCEETEKSYKSPFHEVETTEHSELETVPSPPLPN